MYDRQTIFYVVCIMSAYIIYLYTEYIKKKNK